MVNYHKTFRDKHKKAGLCRDCSNPLCSESTVFCMHCRDKNRARSKVIKKKYYGDPVKRRFMSIKSRSKQYGLEFDLSKSSFTEWYNLQKKQCHYCGVSAEELKKTGRKKNMLTIDRKNNAIGYRLDNICLACFRCNNMKSNFFTEAEWGEICEKYVKPRLDEYHVTTYREDRPCRPASAEGPSSCIDRSVVAP